MSLIAGITGTLPSARAQKVPADAAPYCALPSAGAFNQWFQSGSAALNGMVLPADSVTFSNPANDNCPFYLWAEQMFMWVTSQIQANSGYGGFVPGNGPVPSIFDSTAFYDISPPDGNGNRNLVPHPVVQSFVRFAGPRVRKAGPNGLPVLTSKDGKMLEVEPQRKGPTGKALIADANGKPVEIARVRIDEKKAQALLCDAQGKPIPFPLKTSSPGNKGHSLRVMELRAICNVGAVCNGGGGGGGVFLETATGSILETESGQAAGGTNMSAVLEAQNGSLIYYAIIVNDVYAWFLAGTNAGGIAPAPTHFPTTQSDLNGVLHFAASQGAAFPDAIALTIELKTSWIDASTLPPGAAAGYITTQATIPTYNTSGSRTWTPNGQKKATLALVGMHIVGSVAGHPEMIFATFEHLGNAPNAAYSYVSATPRPPTRGYQTIALPRDTSGAWLLSATGSGGPFNISHMILAPGGVIEAQSPFTISPGDTLRQKPWGSSSDQIPNPNVSSAAMANTQVISVANSVHSLMAAAGAGADVRNNYVLLGATWTINGAAPTQNYGLPTGFYKGFNAPDNIVGSSQLFNSTMETYDQGAGTTMVQNNMTGFSCFDCHGGGGGSVAMSHLSHIFGAIHATGVPK